MDVLVRDELMSNLTAGSVCKCVCVCECECVCVSVVTDVEQSGAGLASVKLPSNTSFNRPFPITSAI